MARTTYLVAFAAGLLWIAGADRPAGAQAIDWFASQAGLTLSHQPGSARLEAMGGLGVSVRDEDRELNLLDYGQNICGYLTDSDYRRWDFWQNSSSYLHDERDGAGVRTRTRSTLSEAGGRMSWRSGTSRVVGGDLVYDEWHNSLERGPTSKVRGPMWGLFAAQKVDRLTLGGAIRMSSDNEDVRSESVFAIRHESSGARGIGGLALDLGTLQLGAQAEIQSNTIRGLSRDESRFHEDKLTWKRPTEIYDLSAFWTPIEALTGAVRARLTRLDGREEVKISWSDRMPSNPSRSNFLDRTGTFKETVDGTEIGTRWEAIPFEGFQVGARFDWFEATDDVVEGKNYKGSRRAGHTSETDLTGAGGASYETGDGKFRVGAEGWIRNRESKERQIEADVVTKARQAEFRSGAEYYVSDWLAVRGGFQRVAFDSDRDRPRTLQVGNGYTLGVGYVARGGLYQIDAAIRVMNLDPDYSGYPNTEDSRTSITLGARFLL
jgi:hypothetical protein